LQAVATKVSSLSISSANPATPSEFVIFIDVKDIENSSSTPTFNADAPADNFRFRHNPGSTRGVTEIVRPCPV
jgi:hypothetical protein